MVFKRYLKFKKKRKGTAIENGFQVDYKLMFKTRVFAIMTFMKLFKNIQKRRATLKKIKFFDKRSEPAVHKSRVAVKKF